jgi:glycosyltransferase involved in cell wall biosynthesis
MGNIDSNKILIIDYCNFEDYQIGGHLSFAKNLLSAFTNQLALVGITTNKNDIVGKWFKKTINGVTYDYFALTKYNKSRSKHLLPDRLKCYWLLRLYKKRILQIDIQNVFVQRHEILPAIINFGYSNICYRFPGLESPLGISKYWFGKFFAGRFDKVFFTSLIKTNLVLASGDENAIMEMVKRSNGVLQRSSVIKFPTRINTDIFKPMDRLESREKLNLPINSTIIVTTGRLAHFKGWEFMVDCFALFVKEVSDSRLVFIGDGEDFNKLQDYISFNSLNEKILMVGKKGPEMISLYLNASDLFIMGSLKEGWSTSLSEAIACGIPACVTNFSSAKEIILQGKNGYVVDERDKDIFVQTMIKALQIPRGVKIGNSNLYSTGRLKVDILKHWKLT